VFSVVDYLLIVLLPVFKLVAFSKLAGSCRDPSCCCT